MPSISFAAKILEPWIESYDDPTVRSGLDLWGEPRILGERTALDASEFERFVVAWPKYLV